MSSLRRPAPDPARTCAPGSPEAPDQVEALRVTPLRQLNPEQLGPFLVNAVTMWGDVTYFKHFLPRLLELVADGAMEDWSYPSFLPNRLALCWTDGTEEERDAITL